MFCTLFISLLLHYLYFNFCFVCSCPRATTYVFLVKTFSENTNKMCARTLTATTPCLVSYTKCEHESVFVYTSRLHGYIALGAQDDEMISRNVNTQNLLSIDQRMDALCMRATNTICMTAWLHDISRCATVYCFIVFHNSPISFWSWTAANTIVWFSFTRWSRVHMKYQWNRFTEKERTCWKCFSSKKIESYKNNLINCLRTNIQDCNRSVYKIIKSVFTRRSSRRRRRRRRCHRLTFSFIVLLFIVTVQCIFIDIASITDRWWSQIAKSHISTFFTNAKCEMLTIKTIQLDFIQINYIFICY